MAAPCPISSMAAAITLCCFFLYFLLITCPVSSQYNQTFKTYSFPVFKTTNTKFLSFYGSANLNHQGELQLTPSPHSVDELNQTAAGKPETRKIGLVYLTQNFTLFTYFYKNYWSQNSITWYTIQRYAIYKTSFDVTISWDRNQTSDDYSVATEDSGMSVMIFEFSDHPPGQHTEWKFGGQYYLPLLTYEFYLYDKRVVVRKTILYGNNDTANYSTTGHFGNSVLPQGTDLSIKHTIWIESNPTAKQVYIAEQGMPKPASPILEFSGEQYTADGNCYVGLTAGSTATGSAVYYKVSSWTLSVEVIPEPEEEPYMGYNSTGPTNNIFQKKIVISTSSTAALLLVVVVVLGIYVWKKKKETDFLGKALRSLPGMPKEFKYADLKKATNNFSLTNKLGQGGFGEVYKGKLRKEQTFVAVKRFLRETDQAGFLAELTIINCLRHRNLVRLLGWSYRNKRLLLVYEYMPNGSLDKHLFHEQNKTTLKWEYRSKILSGVAAALYYLHDEYNQKVVHRDIKASNIMLDADFNAYLGDFGLARAIDNGRTSYVDGDADGMPGTWGYIAPECLLTGKATRESDVFAFGAVVLEVVTGRRPGAEYNGFRSLVDGVWALREDEQTLLAVDPRLKNEYDMEDARRLILLGLACSHPISTSRPKALDIVQVMSKSAPVPVVPLTKPAFTWMSMSVDGDNTNRLEDANNIDQIPLFFSHDESNTASCSTKGKGTNYYTSGSVSSTM